MDLSEETGLDLLCRLGVNLKCSSGVDAVDRMMGGGFDPGEVYEFVGEMGAGKTQLIYGLTSSFLTRHSGYVVWIHSGGAFFPSRLLEFLPQGKSEEEKLKLLERVLLTLAWESSDLIDCLEKIHARRGMKLVIVDGIGSILNNSAWKIREGGLKQLESVASNLHRCAVRGSTVVLSNHLVHSDGIQYPALGIVWRKRLVTQRFLVGRDEVSRFFRPVGEEDEEDYKASGSGIARFSVGPFGVHDFDDLSLRSSL